MDNKNSAAERLPIYKCKSNINPCRMGALSEGNNSPLITKKFAKILLTPLRSSDMVRKMPFFTILLPPIYLEITPSLSDQLDVNLPPTENLDHASRFLLLINADAWLSKYYYPL
jgi:hypothetical protein